LIFIVFLSRKKQKPKQRLGNLRRLERLAFASASLFLLLALKFLAVASGSQKLSQKGSQNCFIINKNTVMRRPGKSATACYRREKIRGENS
jgi:hypothetical protein